LQPTVRRRKKAWTHAALATPNNSIARTSFDLSTKCPTAASLSTLVSFSSIVNRSNPPRKNRKVASSAELSKIKRISSTEPNAAETTKISWWSSIEQ
ncbi:hypothetical protein K0M31_019861, partial [Melipona bicolor]